MAASAPVRDPETEPVQQPSARAAWRGAADRTTRLIAGAVGVASIVFGLLGLDQFTRQINPAAPGESIAAYSVAIGAPVLLAVLALAAPIRVVRACAGAIAIAYLLLLIGWALTGPVGLLPHGEVWPISITAIPAVAAAVAYPRAPVWGYLILTTFGVFLVGDRASYADYATIEALELALYSFVFCAVFVGCSLAAVQNAQRLDGVVAEIALRSRERAARIGRERERARIEALIHDGVISTLLMAGRGALDSTAGAAQARRTLLQLADARELQRSAVTSSELADRIGALAAENAVTFRREEPSALLLSAEVADALESAAAEALRNSLRHAGSATRVAVVTVTDAGVRVSVTDDGVGFDPGAVPPERLGISHSITARVQSVGGTAEVESAPGEGARVVLRWEAS